MLSLRLLRLNSRPRHHARAAPGPSKKQGALPPFFGFDSSYLSPMPRHPGKPVTKTAPLPFDPVAASQFLAGLDEDWARLVAQVGPCRHQTQPGREPYEALMRAVAHQQLHGKAAEAILGRLIALQPDHVFPTPAQLLVTEPEQLRACGFSQRKVDTLRAIAEGAQNGMVPSRLAAARLDDETLIERLTSLPGIGRWTVEILLIYSLERPDILPVDDFGVREGYRHLKSLPKQPGPRALARIAEAWSPYRTAAAWYLWRVVEQPDYRRAPKLTPTA